MTLRTALAVTCVGITLGTLGLVTPARAATLHVLTGDNSLVQVDTTTLRATRPAYQAAGSISTDRITKPIMPVRQP